MPRKTSASKRELNGGSAIAEDRPQKKVKLLDNSDDEDSGAETGAGFKVNAEYARRFEHNKKRAEQHRRERPLRHHQTDTDPLQLKRSTAKARLFRTKMRTRRTQKRVSRRTTPLNCSTKRSTRRSWPR